MQQQHGSWRLILALGCAAALMACSRPPAGDSARGASPAVAQAAGLPPSAAPPFHTTGSAATPNNALEAAYLAGIGRLLPLLAIGSPRERLAAALLSFDRQGLDQQQLLTLALPTAGQDTLMARSALATCLQVPSCPREELLQLTAELAVDDAQLQVLRLQLLPGDQREQLWQAASQAARFDDGFQQRLDHLLTATDALSTSTSAASWGSIHAAAVAAAHTDNVLGSVMLHCRSPEVSAEQARQCRQIGALMADSSGLLTAMAGVSLLRRFASNSGQASDLAQRHRQLQWLQQANAQLLGDNLAAGAEFVQLWRRLGERAALEQLLRVRGLPLSPPPHWQPGMPIG